MTDMHDMTKLQLQSRYTVSNNAAYQKAKSYFWIARQKE